MYEYIYSYISLTSPVAGLRHPAQQLASGPQGPFQLLAQGQMSPEAPQVTGIDRSVHKSHTHRSTHTQSAGKALLTLPPQLLPRFHKPLDPSLCHLLTSYSDLSLMLLVTSISNMMFNSTLDAATYIS